MLKNFYSFKAKNLKVFELEDAKKFIDMLKGVVEFIQKDKATRI